MPLRDQEQIIKSAEPVGGVVDVVCKQVCPDWR